jgi:serine/threonine protein kinase/class 3 adenylate cyclase
VSVTLSNEHRARIEEFRRKQRTGILVLLFTDMVGSTQLKQDLGDPQAVAITMQHHAVVRELLTRFPDSKEIDTAGDSFFIVFVKPSDAVKFALMMQAAVRNLAAQIQQPLADRIGIHAGEVFLEDREGSRKPLDLFGIQVDCGARVMSLAEPNQVFMTRFVFDNARQLLRGEELPDVGPLSWLSHGPYLLKGIEEPLEICEVGETGIAPLHTPPDSEKAHRYTAGSAEQVPGWRPALQQMVPNTQWVLEKKLGEGGFGEVWLARHKTLKDKCVFKFCFRADRVRSLKREVTLFKLLRERAGENPGIVAVRDVFFEEPPYYIMMDYAEGDDLDRWVVAQGGMEKVPPAIRLEIVAQLADALQSAHDAGIIHRDVKPSNIIVCGSDPGTLRVKLTDFGIGQVLSPHVLAGRTQMGFTQATTTGSSDTGTPLYMAPELLAGKPASTRSDVYSLGVVLYQLLVGDLTQPATVDWARHIDNELLREDLARCLAGNPQERFAAAAELAHRLRTLPERQSALNRRDAEFAEKLKAAHRKGVLRTTAVAMGVILLLSGLVVWSLHRLSVANEDHANAARLSDALAPQLKDLEQQAAEWRQQKAEDSQLKLEIVCTLAGQGLTSKAQVSPVENSFAVITRKGGVLIFSTEGKLLRRLALADKAVNAITYSPDGRGLLASTTDGAVNRWDLASGMSQTVFTNGEWAIKRMIYLSNPPRGVLGLDVDYSKRSTNNSGLIFQESDAHVLKRFSSFGQNDYQFLAASLDGRLLGVLDIPGDKRAGFLLDSSSCQVKATLWDDRYPSGPLSIAIAPDNNTVALGYAPSHLSLWDGAQQKELRLVEAHSNWVTALAFSPDSKRLISGGGDSTARVWVVQTGREIGRIRFEGESTYVNSVGFSPDGHLIVAAADNDVLVIAKASR